MTRICCEGHFAVHADGKGRRKLLSLAVSMRLGTLCHISAVGHELFVVFRAVHRGRSDMLGDFLVSRYRRARPSVSHHSFFDGFIDSRIISDSVYNHYSFSRLPGRP